MAFSSIRARQNLDLPANRASSPYDDNVFTTANTFTNVLHSTPQRENTASQRNFPLEYDQYPDPSENGSDGSADMSIEIGRGLKRGAQDYSDISADVVFSFGNDDSQYEVTGTPPVRPHAPQRKSDGALRKEASVRRATEVIRGNDALKRGAGGTKQRAVSDNGPRMNGGHEPQQNAQPTATFQVRGTRFSRQVSASYNGLPNRFTTDGGLQMGQETPRRPTANNVTVQSVTHTAQSFMLPDLPNIAELVAGVRKDGTPVFKRGHAARTRFAHAASKRQSLPELPVDAIAVPNEEKHIYASLQLLQDRILQLEKVNSEAQKRADEYEDEIIELRSQLSVATRRPDSALGSEDDASEPAGSRQQSVKLQARVKALQDRLNKAERKISITEITVSRVSKERDALITQIGSAYFNSEEVARENETFRESHGQLQDENEDLMGVIAALRLENAQLRDQLSNTNKPPHKKTSATQRKASSSQDNARESTNEVARNQDDVETQRSTRHARQRSEGVIPSKKAPAAATVIDDDSLPRRHSSGHLESTFVHDLAVRIEREVQKHRDEAAAAKAADERQSRNHTTRSTSLRARSRSQRRKDADVNQRATSKRHTSAPPDMEDSDVELTTQLDVTRKSQRSQADAVDDARDLTELTVLDESVVSELRRKLEAERQAERLAKQQSTLAQAENDKTTASITRQSMPRKSSMKDLTGRADEGTGRLSLQGHTIDDIIKASKTVRVQSPHSSQGILHPEDQDPEAEDVSFSSNISRRRRRTESIEGMTSAFIIPDITIHTRQSLPTRLDTACIQHSAAQCTICVIDAKEKDIPMPIPVTDREGYGDITDATIRPAQDPAVALAIVIKTLTDEIAHLKIQREVQNRLYNKHDPALSKRARETVKAKLDAYTADIEKRSDQVYKLYDVLEGQKQAGKEVEIEDSLQSVGIDPAEISGRVGRKAPSPMVDEMSDAGFSDDLPWEGLSDVESEL